MLMGRVWTKQGFREEVSPAPHPSDRPARGPGVPRHEVLPPGGSPVSTTRTAPAQSPRDPDEEGGGAGSHRSENRWSRREWAYLEDTHVPLIREIWGRTLIRDVSRRCAGGEGEGRRTTQGPGAAAQRRGLQFPAGEPTESVCRRSGSHRGVRGRCVSHRRPRPLQESCLCGSQTRPGRPPRLPSAHALRGKLGKAEEVTQRQAGEEKEKGARSQRETGQRRQN